MESENNGWLVVRKKKIPNLIRARLLVETQTFPTPSGEYEVTESAIDAGCWVIESVDGELYPFPDERFDERYDVLGISTDQSTPEGMK